MADLPEEPQNWWNLSPDDPKYKPLQVILGVMLRQESIANGNFITNGTAQGAEKAVLTWIEEKYDAWGNAAVLLTENVSKAQEFSEVLAESVETTLAAFGSVFEVCEEHGISAEALMKQARIRLLARMEHWKALVFQRGLDGELHALKKDSDGQRPLKSPEPNAVEPAQESLATLLAPGSVGIEGQRAAIDAFIALVAEKTNRKITRTDIWKAAGYKDATEFERFQRDDPRTTKSAAAAFRRILTMAPEKFIELLDRKSEPK